MSSKLTCPQCGKRMTMNFSTSKVFCPHCGYVRPDEISALKAQRQQAQASRPRPRFSRSYIGKVSPGAEAAFETGHDLLDRGDKQGALRAFQRAAEYQPDFVEAHLWIAKITDDEKTCHHHLDTVLAYEPNNAEATRMKMVLSGRLTPEQAARTRQADGPQTLHAEGPIRAKTTELLCPVCNGHLTVNDAAGRVECRFCGYSAPQAGPAGAGSDLLTMALLERKAQAVRWNVGQRLVLCQQCGAEHTLLATKLAARCRFCGSGQVILSDALKSFEQPDGILPFDTTPEDATTRIHRQLNTFGQRFANIFNTNRVNQVVVEGVYMPFWVFDVTVEILRSRTTQQMGLPVTDTWTDMDAVDSVAVSGVVSPPPHLVERLLPYDLSKVRPYAPEWLATYPAELYSKDFDRASLDAREIVANAMRRKHKPVTERQYYDERGEQQAEVTHSSVRVQNMIFQLLLLPVWIATLFEVDGDVRLALVNGQTGKTVLGSTARGGDTSTPRA